MQQSIIKIKLLVATLMFMCLLTVVGFSTNAMAQTAAPTPAPSGSNPTRLAPTDVSPDFALYCVLGFFAFLLIWLVAATFYTRAGVFEVPDSEPGY